MDVKSIQIFAFILSKSKGRILKANSPTELHKIFYKLSKCNSELMEGFDFKKTTNPYSSVLEDVIKLFLMAGILSIVYSGINFLGYSIKESKLRKLLPENMAEIPKELKGLQVPKELFINK